MNKAERLDGLKMEKIPAGSFLMGSDTKVGKSVRAQPERKVTLDAFEMSSTPITQGQYLDIMGENVSWYDAVRFCNRLSDKSGLERCYTGGPWWLWFIDYKR